MSNNLELDLRGVVIPICLLQCKSTLIRMNATDTLHILVNDPELIEDLTNIVKRSQDREVKSFKKNEYFVMFVGPSSRREPGPNAIYHHPGEHSDRET